jgi:cysteine desulfurase
MIYLDEQATTRLAPETRAAMLPWLDAGFANPHSAHSLGRQAAAAVEVARDEVAALLPPGGRPIFTSGATEALNWASQALLPPGTTLAVSAIEHAAVLDTADWLARRGVRVIHLPVTADGIVDRTAAEALLPDRLDLVAVMQVNNEIGTIQPIAAIAALAKARGARLLVDAVQGFGRLAAPAEADLIAVSAHKIYGPKGIGALWLRDGLALDPLIHGGGQQHGLRAGTLSPALCAGFGAAARLMGERRAEDRAHVEALRDAFRDGLGEDWTVNGSLAERWPGNLNIRRDGLDAARLMSECRDLAFSLGSACASGSGRPSHVLRAIGLDDRQARGSLRIGFGRYTRRDEVQAAARRIATAARAQEI